VNRLELARRPTPVHRLERLSGMLGAEVWVKRDDLTGLGLSGNKVRKLEFLMAEATERGCDTVITTGGIQSNHARATAVAARMCGMRPVLLLRGEEPATPDGNLLLDHLLGAELHWCTAEEYGRRDALMDALAGHARARGARPYVVPEGGSNRLGAQGYVAAAHELLEQIDEPFDVVVVGLGSGGTAAGLALGPDLGPIRAIAVCDDRASFVARIREIGGAELSAPGTDWDVLDQYRGPAYGVADLEVWQTIRTVAQTEGLLLDPVYTGKAMHALVSEVRAGRWGGRVLFWHTGGAFGLFGRGHEV